MVAVVEVKCLTTDNHSKALYNIDSDDDLRQCEWAKYCQIQTQMLCAGVSSGMFVFYDPRHDTPLHTVQVFADKDWKAAFLNRVELAPAYFKTVKAEDDSKEAFVESDTPAPEIANLPRVQIDLDDVALYHQTPEALVAKIQQQAGNFVFDMSISKGRDACRSHAANIIRCITPAISASKSIAADAKKVIEADLYFRKVFEKGVREIADHTRRPLSEWEAEQDKIDALVKAEREASAREQAAIEQERQRQERERAAAEAEQQRVDAVAAKKAAGVAHQKRVNNDIAARLVAHGIDEASAKLVITAAARKELGALVINY
jgi:hypothetical protein